MKHIIFVSGLALALAYPTAYAADDKKPETKKVCIDVKDKEGKPVKDAKTGKTKQTCKDVKVHKKLEGKEVPNQKK
jgi:hypothetical protein